MPALKNISMEIFTQPIAKIQGVISWNICHMEKGPVHFKFEEKVKPISSIPYPVPKIYKTWFEKEVKCWILLISLKNLNDLEWGGDPYFAQTKQKTSQIYFLNEFRN